MVRTMDLENPCLFGSLDILREAYVGYCRGLKKDLYLAAYF